MTTACPRANWNPWLTRLDFVIRVVPLTYLTSDELREGFSRAVTADGEKGKWKDQVSFDVTHL